MKKYLPIYTEKDFFHILYDKEEQCFIQYHITTKSNTTSYTVFLIMLANALIIILGKVLINPTTYYFISLIFMYCTSKYIIDKIYNSIILLENNKLEKNIFIKHFYKKSLENIKITFILLIISIILFTIFSYLFIKYGSTYVFFMLLATEMIVFTFLFGGFYESYKFLKNIKWQIHTKN